jgi:hypothetical protein
MISTGKDSTVLVVFLIVKTASTTNRPVVLPTFIGRE